MRKRLAPTLVFLTVWAIIAGCSRQPAPAAQPAPPPAESAYVAPQSAPVLPPSYPSLAGPVIQQDTASIPIIQGR